MIIVLGFAIGLIVGSFLNVVILRGAKGEPLTGRSRCDVCGHTLSVSELIPVASFVIQKARCRSCGTALSWQYPLVEFATALLYAVAAWFFLRESGPEPAALLMLGATYLGIAAFVVIMVADIRFQIIPNGAVLTLLILGIFESIARHAFFSDGAWALGIALFFAAMWLVSKGRWLGLGDAKLTLATSILVGFPASLAAFLFSFWLGGVAAVPMLILGRKGMKSRIPFGPFILAGTIGAYFFSAVFFRATGLAWVW